MLALAVLSASFVSPSAQRFSPRACVQYVRMVDSWYDTGLRLGGKEDDGARSAEECLLEAESGVDALACNVPNPSRMLQRYLQLLTVLSGEPMPNTAVEALVRKAEYEAGPVALDDAQVALLQGEWQLVWQQNSEGATRSQKALAPLPQLSNFIVDERQRTIFRNIVSINKRVQVVADVEYSPPSASAADGERAPANRLNSRICAAGLTVQLGKRFGWSPLRLPLPLRGQGWLDVTYLSDNMRITRGNRGGLFVHIKPRMLTREAAEATKGILPVMM